MRLAPRALLVAAALLISPASALALPPAEPDPGAWVPNAPVSTVVHHGSTTYLGGFFDWVGPWTGGGASLSVPQGGPDPRFPTVAGGAILASAPDGSGGVFIGGAFTSVGGQSIPHLAHIFADGSIDSALPAANGQINTLAFVPGSGLFGSAHLYVGGEFGTIGGVQRDGLAEVDLTIAGDTIDDAFAPCTDYAQNDFSGHQPFAFALAVSSTTVYVGGDFDYASGGAANPATHKPTCTNQQTTGSLFAVDRTTGVVNSTFVPNPQGEVDALALSPDGSKLYFGGPFDDIGNGSSGIRKLARASTATGALDTSWNPKIAGDVRALQASGADLYAGGSFVKAGANQLPRSAIAELDANTADATGFNVALSVSPDNSNPVVRGLSLDNPAAPTRLALGGAFASPSGVDELVVVDPATGAIDAGFKPQPGGLVTTATFTASSSLYAGGYFVSVGAVPRTGIVALDGYGHPLPVAFAGAAQERELAVSPDGSTIYATGDTGAGAWSTSTGAKLPWTPPCCVAALAVAPDGSAVYLGGGFTTVGGMPHVRLAAVNPATGAPTAWRPDPDGVVDAIALSPDGQTVYAGGTFQHIGTSVAARSNLAAVSTSSGDATAWAPNPNGQIDAITTTRDGHYVFAGGAFTSIGASAQARTRLAELTTSTGNPTPFGQSSSPDDVVTSIAEGANGSVIYVGGQFAHVSSQAVPEIAALDGGSGSPFNWPVFLSGSIGGSIAADGDTAWTGNWGSQIGTGRRPYYAQFSATPVTIAPPTISPGPQAGRVSTCNSGGWTNAPAAISLTWLLDGHAISGAASRTFAPETTQVGHRLSCAETATNPGGSATATSASVTVAPAPAPRRPSLGLKVQIKPTRFHRATGTAVRIRLTAAATVTLTFVRVVPGHRTKHGCSTRVRRGRRCALHRPAGSITWRLHTGLSRLTVARKPKLRPGTYLATFTARTGATRSGPVTITLTVVR